MSELSPTDAAIRAIEENKRLAAERDTLAREHAQLVTHLLARRSRCHRTYSCAYGGPNVCWMCKQDDDLLQRIRDRESKEKSNA